MGGSTFGRATDLFSLWYGWFHRGLACPPECISECRSHACVWLQEPGVVYVCWGLNMCCWLADIWGWEMVSKPCSSVLGLAGWGCPSVIHSFKLWSWQEQSTYLCFITCIPSPTGHTPRGNKKSFPYWRVMEISLSFVFSTFLSHPKYSLLALMLTEHWQIR